MACIILVPQPRNELGPWVMRMWGSNHWTYKEFPLVALFALSVYVCGNVLSNYFALKWLEIVSVCVLMPQLNVQMYFFSFDMGDLFLNNFVLYLCEIFIWSSCLSSLLPYWRAQLRSDWTGPSEEGSQVWRCPNSDQGSYKTIGPGLPGQSSAYKSVLQCRGRRLDPWLDNWDCVCLGAPKPTPTTTESACSRAQAAQVGNPCVATRDHMMQQRFLVLQPRLHAAKWMTKYILKDYGPSRSVPWQWSLCLRKWSNWAVTKQGWEITYIKWDWANP